MNSYNNLAAIYQEQGNFKEGAKLPGIPSKAYGKHYKQMTSLFSIQRDDSALSCDCFGEHSEVETLLREALDAYTDQLGPDDQITLRAKSRLAWILHGQSKYKEAEDMSFETRTAQKRTIGENNPDCIKSLFLFANDLQAQSKFEEALSHKRRVYAQATDAVGPRHQ